MEYAAVVAAFNSWASRLQSCTFLAMRTRTGCCGREEVSSPYRFPRSRTNCSYSAARPLLYAAMMAWVLAFPPITAPSPLMMGAPFCAVGLSASRRGLRFRLISWICTWLAALLLSLGCSSAGYAGFTDPYSSLDTTSASAGTMA